VELGELVVLWGGVKLEEIRAGRDDDAAKRPRLADRARSRAVGAELEAAGPVGRLGTALKAELLLDNSPWARLGQPAVPDARPER